MCSRNYFDANMSYSETSQSGELDPMYFRERALSVDATNVFTCTFTQRVCRVDRPLVTIGKHLNLRQCIPKALGVKVSENWNWVVMILVTSENWVAMILVTSDKETSSYQFC